MDRPIGVFDSGVGGLSVTKEIIKRLPNEQIVYFGDTKRAPYGNRTKEVITDFTKQIVRFLVSKNCKALVVACNTICVSCLEELQKEFEIPIIGVIDASVEEACRISKTGVGIFATLATIKSEAHKEKINDIRKDLDVYGVACPLFVPIVEEGFSNTEVAYYAAKEYLKMFSGNNIDSLILGCTHYPLMKDSIEKAAGSNITIIDPAQGTTLELEKILKEKEIFSKENNKPEHKFYYSGDGDKFNSILKSALGNNFYTEKTSVENF